MCVFVVPQRLKINILRKNYQITGPLDPRYNFFSKTDDFSLALRQKQCVVSQIALFWWILELFKEFFSNKKQGNWPLYHLPTYFSTQQQQKCAFLLLGILLTTILVLQFFEHIMVKSKQTEIPQFFFCVPLTYINMAFFYVGRDFGLQRQAKS